jgi:hypothetical protein
MFISMFYFSSQIVLILDEGVYDWPDLRMIEQFPLSHLMGHLI